MTFIITYFYVNILVKFIIFMRPGQWDGKWLNASDTIGIYYWNFASVTLYKHQKICYTETTAVFVVMMKQLKVNGAVKPVTKCVGCLVTLL